MLDSTSPTAITHYAATPSQLVHLIDYATSRVDFEGKPKPAMAVFVWGAPGIGKTELVRTVAKGRNSRLVALHLPQYDPTDVKGIPVRMDDGTIRWMPSSYLPQQQTMFLNNLTRANRGGTMQIDWAYAIDLAFYVLDEDKNEIARYNDPCLDNMGDATFEFTKTSNTGWHIVFGHLPSEAAYIRVEDKALVFLDELSAAEPSTQNAALQLVLEGRVGEYDVPSSVPVLAAGNREEDGAFVQTLSHPLCNRFEHITLIPDAEEWIEWALFARVRPEVIGFIKWDPSAIFDYDPDNMTNGQYGFATPRTLKFLSDQYAPLSFFERMTNGNTDKAEKLRMIKFTGLIGAKRASQFVGYVQIMHDMPSPEDIMAGRVKELGNVERSKSFGLLYALIYNLENAYLKHYDPEQSPSAQSPDWDRIRDNVINFINASFDSESAAWALTVLVTKTKLNIVSLRSPAFLNFSQKHVQVFSTVSGGRK